MLAQPRYRRWLMSTGAERYVSLQHELLQRLAPVLEEAMHPFDCCASSAGDRRPASGFSKPLPISRRASAASHEDLHCLINQVRLWDCFSP